MWYEGDQNKKVPKIPLWLIYRSRISQGSKRPRFQSPFSHLLAVWAQALQAGNVRAGLEVQEIYCPCRRERGRGRSEPGARGLPPVKGEGKEGAVGGKGLRLQCSSESQALYCRPFGVLISLFWKIVALRNNSGEQMSGLVTTPTYVKYLNSVARSTVLLKLANPRFPNLHTNTDTPGEILSSVSIWLVSFNKYRFLSHLEEHYPQGNLLIWRIKVHLSVGSATQYWKAKRS